VPLNFSTTIEDRVMAKGRQGLYFRKRECEASLKGFSDIGASFPLGSSRLRMKKRAASRIITASWEALERQTSKQLWLGQQLCLEKAQWLWFVRTPRGKWSS